MSLCNTNWKDLLSGDNHPKPDVEFIVAGVDGQRVFPAHRYLLAIVSPVFKEQFYEKAKTGMDNDVETGSLVRITLDTSPGAAEALFRFIYEKMIGKVSFHDWFELLRLSERYQMEKLSIDVKEAIIKFIVDNSHEVVEEIWKMKEEKITKEIGHSEVDDVNKGLKEKLRKSDQSKKALRNIGREFRERLEEKNKELCEVLAGKTLLEKVQEKLERTNEDLLNDQKRLIEEKEDLVKENRTLLDQNMETTKEKDLINGNCKKLAQEIAQLVEESAKTKELLRIIEENAEMKEKSSNSTSTISKSSSTIKMELLEVKRENLFEREEGNFFSYTSGTRTLLPIPTSEYSNYIEKIKEKEEALELENKILKARVSTAGENFKKALSASNAKYKSVADEKKLLEEEMESMKSAYGTQIDFLKKEHGKVLIQLSNSREKSSTDIPLQPLTHVPPPSHTVVVLDSPPRSLSPKMSLRPALAQVSHGSAESGNMTTELDEIKAKNEAMKTKVAEKDEAITVLINTVKNLRKKLASSSEVGGKMQSHVSKVDEMDAMKAAFGVQINALKTAKEKAEEAKLEEIKEKKKLMKVVGKLQQKLIASQLTNQQLQERGERSSNVVSTKIKDDVLSFDLSDEDALEESEDLRMSLDQRKIEDEESEDLRMSLDQRKRRRVVMDANDKNTTDDIVGEDKLPASEKHVVDTAASNETKNKYFDVQEFNKVREFTSPRKRLSPNRRQRVVDGSHINVSVYEEEVEDGEFVESGITEMVKKEAEDLNMIHVTVPNHQDDYAPNPDHANGSKKRRRVRCPRENIRKKSSHSVKKIKSNEKTLEGEMKDVSNENSEKKKEISLENLVIRNNAYASKSKEGNKC